MSSLEPPASAPSQKRPDRGAAIASLAIGLVGIPTLGLCGVGLVVGLALGIGALVLANKQPAVYAGKRIAIAGIVVNGLHFLALSGALLMRTAHSNHSMAIGDIRSVISAQAHYAAANGGYHDTLECLATPSDCIPGYPPTDPWFMGPGDMPGLATERRGYARSFQPGPAATPEAGEQERISPSSMTSFAYVAVPIRPFRTGMRAVRMAGAPSRGARTFPESPRHRPTARCSGSTRGTASVSCSRRSPRTPTC